ncbi:MAG: hypothetical protein J6L00_01490 [Clostridia bacterium]|nr:hypothetical protein [Clostridia bacterium]
MKRKWLAGCLVCLLLLLVGVLAYASRQPERWSDAEAKAATERHQEERMEHLWGYLDNFKDETVESTDDPDEIARITEKNALIKEYTDYVNNIRSKEMADAEYEEHYDYLMGLFSRLCELEPDPTAEEYLAIQLDRLLFRLEDELYFCKKFGEEYAENRNIDLWQLNRCIEHLIAFKEKISTQQLPYEQMKQEYMTYLEEAGRACSKIALHFYALE